MISVGFLAALALQVVLELRNTKPDNLQLGKEQKRGDLKSEERDECFSLSFFFVPHGFKDEKIYTERYTVAAAASQQHFVEDQ